MNSYGETLFDILAAGIYSLIKEIKKSRYEHNQTNIECKH